MARSRMTPRDPSALKIVNLTKRFPGVCALDSVEFELTRGEVHAIVGENGAGKSTLVRIISGVYSKDSGEIFLDGREVEIHDPSVALALGISAIHQELDLIGPMTVAENVMLGMYPRSIVGFVNHRRLVQQAEEIIERLELDIDPRTPVSSLTVPEQQLIAICMALARKCNVLILDEPTASLNEDQAQKLFEIIRSLTAGGSSVIYVTHRLEELFQLADRVTVLRDGKKVGERSVGETDKEELVSMMIGRELETYFPKRSTPIGEIILEARGLRVVGSPHPVSFVLHEGEILAIYGLLGSGRSNLIRTLFGDLPASGGQMLIHGKPLQRWSPLVARRMGLGFVPADRHGAGLIPPLTVRENVTLCNVGAFTSFGLIRLGSERGRTRFWIDSLRIDATGPEQTVSNLSGGNQQKVIVARWMEAASDILLLHEPTRGIDVGAKVEILDLLQDLCGEGAGIIMVSSELPEVLAMADRILVMSRGAITGEFTREEATQEEIVRCALGDVDFKGGR